MYAIVDIETTGSHPQDNGITEIAIVLHDGEKIEGRYETLLRPGYRIPPYVAQLTGITNEMTEFAPTFGEVAQQVFTLLNNRIFIAHNVNFDFAFLKFHLRLSGFEWTPKKLCTLKLSRKAFPGMNKYGLGHICRALDIKVQNRHRATGDVNATVELFEKILGVGGEKIIRDFLKKENREQILPPNLPAEKIKGIPYVPGVYYFHDAKDKVIYVGKAKSLKQRVVSHFTGLNTGRKRQEFLRNIHSITYKECATELMASILESVEIKRLWPLYNDSQKRFEQRFGIYTYEDNRGYHRLAIDKKRKYFEPVVSFNLLTDAHRMLWKLVKEHELHPSLCFLDKSSINENDYPEREFYNSKVGVALNNMRSHMGTYAILEPAVYGTDYSCILVENGRFYGMGTLKQNVNFSDIGFLKQRLTMYPENEVIRSMISGYARKFPSRVLTMSNEA